MKDWIEKTLDPPGAERKNLRSLFSFIGRVFGIVKNDAITAHNAFFPYLSDPDKLREHGQVLMIPEIPNDTENEYRERVATASFYLMRAGERAYIHEQLRSHFGDRYLLTEEFLQVYIKILDLSDEHRIWVYRFLDGILDPNISFTIAEWFQFFDNLVLEDFDTKAIRKNERDSFASITRNGQIIRDGSNVYCSGVYDSLSMTIMRNGMIDMEA